MHILTGNIKRIAKIGGKEVPYDLCGDHKKDYTNWGRAKTEYLGKGYILSVNDVIQNGIGTKTNTYFWRVV